MIPTDLVFPALILGVFVVLVFIPQLREKREHDGLLASLVKGDRVITQSGLHGEIAVVDAETVELEICPGSRITIDKSTVARRAKPAANA